MELDRRVAITCVLAALIAFVVGDVRAADVKTEAPVKGKAQKTSPKALNPQPEVPSKDPATNPKALNPQPEVPSKGGKIQPRELNPQPEVPGKSRKKKKETGPKKPPESATGR